MNLHPYYNRREDNLSPILCPLLFSEAGLQMKVNPRTGKVPSRLNHSNSSQSVAEATSASNPKRNPSAFPTEIHEYQLNHFNQFIFSSESLQKSALKIP